MAQRNLTFENVIKWAVIVILAIVALKVVFTILAVAFVVGGFLLARVLPLVLLAGLVYVAWQWLSKPREGGSSADPMI